MPWVVAIVLCNAVNAQHTCTLTLPVSVVEAGTGRPVPQAVLLLEELTMSTTTDSVGLALFSGLCDSMVTLRVRYLGFEEYRKMVKPGTGTIRVLLRSDTRSLKAADVVAARIRPPATEGADSIGLKSLERSRGTGLAEILTRVSGVTALKTGNNIAKPVIHGLHSQRLLILHAGVRQEGQQWGAEHAPEIDPFVAGRLTVIKGVSSLRYASDALGGIILVEPRELPHDPGIHAELNLVGMSNGRQGVVSGMVEQHLGRFYDLCWRLQGTARRGGNVQTPEFFLENTGVSEYNWSGSVGLERRKAGGEVYFSSFSGDYGVFRGAHIGSLSDLQRIVDEELTLTSDQFSYTIGAPRQEVMHRLLSVRGWLAITGIGKLTVRYGYQVNRRREFDRDRPYAGSLINTDLPELELRLYTHTADLALETRSFRGFTFETGMNVLAQDNQYGGRRFFVPNYRLVNLGSYGVVRRRILAVTEVEAGVRFDMRYQSVFRNAATEVVRDNYSFRLPNYSIGMVYRPDSVNQLRLHAGTAKRAPSINEWFSNGLHHGTATFEIGDPALGIEKAWTISAGFRHAGGPFRMDAAIYFLRIDDYIYLAPALEPVLTVSGAFPSFEYRNVNAVFRGADADLEWKVGSNLSLRSRGSIVLAWNNTAERYLELVPSPRMEHGIRYMFKSRTGSGGPELGISARSVFRQWRYTQGTDYSPPPSAFTLLDLEATAVRRSALGDIRFTLTIDNILNTGYREYLNRLRYYSDEPGRNIILRILVPLNFETAPHNHEH